MPHGDDIENNSELLWELFRKGNKTAYNKLIERYAESLFGFGYRFCQDEDLVKDCVQDLFLHLWERRESLHAVTSVKAYLFKAIRNRILRKQAGSKNIPFDGLSGFLLEISIEEKIIEHQSDIDQAKKIKHILETLPVRQREVIYLRYYENLDYQRIGEIMNINRQSIHNLLQKAYKSFRSEWSLLTLLLATMLHSPFRS